ncbi:MAG: class I SAM-dependent methyltransferase [Spirochaetales bacterium]|nr:class I SAM-dependent methyltransferase [Spirochaetales bacterium]
MKKNIPAVDDTRFSGFSDLYHDVRPRPPVKICLLLKSYFGKSEINTILDLGCGTGLSTAIWKNHSKRCIGIDPNRDMLAIARKKYPFCEFIEASSYNTGQKDHSIDIVTCSQSFHWMEPEATIREVTRILVPGGVFAVYQCTWPVSISTKAEIAYEELFTKLSAIYMKYKDTTPDAKKYSQRTPPEVMRNSGAFIYYRTIFLDNTEPCDAQRFVDIAASQSSVQELLKLNIEEIQSPLSEFKEKVFEDITEEQTMQVSYILHVGIKKDL